MTAASGAPDIVPAIYAIYQTWAGMRALKQELKPFRDVGRAIEDCVGHEQPGVPTVLLGMQLSSFEAMLS